MRYYALLLLIASAAYAAASIGVAAVSALAWPRVKRTLTPAPSPQRAWTIAAWRLAPAAAGFALSAVLTSAFLRFEPADTTEVPGLLLVAFAALTGWLLASALARGAQAWAAAFECGRLLRSCGRLTVRPDGTRIWIVDTDYPVAAVTGIFRTRLLVSRRIINECTPGELDAVVRHEAAHVRRRDNVVRAAMLYLPNPLALVAAGRDMQHAWAAAAEESADDAAVGYEVEKRTVLASALVRVAAMTTVPVPRWMPALAFYEGTNLENRVRRLLQSGRLASRFSRRSLTIAAGALAAFALALTEQAAREIHSLMEAAVSLVP